MPAALNELSGRDLRAAADWFLYVKDNKSRLGRVFAKLEDD